MKILCRLTLIICLVLFPLLPRASSCPNPAPNSTLPHPSLENATILSLQASLTNGSLTSLNLTTAYLARIAAIDPIINSIIALNPFATIEAQVLDDERASGKVRGPLHGIPLLIKDNIDILRLPNTAGANVLADNIPNADAFLVSRLRAAGAIILGKTNLSEWAYFRDFSIPSGWSGLGGQTRNPYVLDRMPGGSSSGTGAAVAASLCSAGVGTDTFGSIVNPSSVNGLVGIKPTLGLISRTGIIPGSEAQDTAGPMARTVSDAAILLEAMAGFDAKDKATRKTNGKKVDYTTYLTEDAVKGVRLGVLRDPWTGFGAEIDGEFEDALDALRSAGAVLVDVELPEFSQWIDDMETAFLYEFRTGIDQYLNESTSFVNSLAEVIAYNDRNSDKELGLYGQANLKQSQATASDKDTKYLQARKKANVQARKDFESLLQNYTVEALVTIAANPAQRLGKSAVAGDEDWVIVGLIAPWGSAARTPTVTVPMSCLQGELPIGITFMGPAWSEKALLGYAHSFETATKTRYSPSFYATIN